MKQIKFALIFLALLISSCGVDSPKSILSDYLKATASGNYEAAYALISSEDQAVKDLQTYQSELTGEEMAALTDFIKEQTDYKILSVEENGNQAEAKVALTMPDLSEMMGDFMALAFQSAFSEEGEGPSEADMAAALEKYKGKDLPKTTKEQTLKLVREAAGWRVFLDWRTNQLLAEARDLQEAENYEAALETYRAVLERDPEREEAQQAAQELEQLLAEQRAREAYLSQVEIMDLQSGYYDTYLDGRIPGVTFKLKNNGNRTLDKVEVIVYFKDENDRVIFEEDYLPFRVSDYSFNDDKPLRPGYIWRLERGKFLTAKDCPEEWKRGNVEAQVTDVEFSEE